MTITIITPWWNHRELERDYWNAIKLAGDCQVIIIDNGSYPPLPNGWRLSANVGFSRACNIGLSLVRTDAVLFLNNDIATGQAGWLDAIVEALEPGVLVGAELHDYSHGTVDGIRLPYLDGWCLAGMRDDLLELGGFDDTYTEPSYFGDNDLSFRARAAGMTLREVRIPLIHLRNRTAGPAQDPRVREATIHNREKFQDLVRETLSLEEIAA